MVSEILGEDWILLFTAPNRFEAEMQKELLENEGVSALILSDDVGGAYPAISKARLYVKANEEKRAREIMNPSTEEQ